MLLILYQILGHAHQEEQNRNYRKCSSYKANMRDLSLVTHNSTKEAACADTEIKDTGKIDIATDEDCSSVQRIVSDWNDTLNTSTVMPHKAQSAIINPGCPAAGSSNNSSTANEIITVRKNPCRYLS